MLTPDDTLKEQTAMTRTEKMLFGCDMKGLGLEIGASYGPVAPKKAGYRVEILDHAPAAVLREKYQDLGADKVQNIEEVDYIWTGEPLHELTGKREHYDWIIASHVIEHTPDLIAFLNQCEAMLNKEGTICLAVPDHRYCFDAFRPVSTPGSVIEAYLEKRNRHRLGTLYDFCSLMVQKGGQTAWDKHTSGDYALYHPDLQFAQSLLEHAQAGSSYIDAHNWVFTPASFRLIMYDCAMLNYINLSISTFYPVSGCEFIVQLKKRSGSHTFSQESRQQLILEVLREQKELAT